MRHLLKQLRHEKHIYVSHQEVEELKKEMLKVFDKKWYDFSVNLTGYFTSGDAFLIRGESSGYSSSGGSYTSLIGKIYIKNKETYIEILIKTNPLFYVFIIVSFVFGLIYFYTGVFQSLNSWIKPLIISTILMFVIPLICMLYAGDAKGRLKKQFETAFNLVNITKNKY